MKLSNYNFMKTPVGANKKYLVEMDGNPVARFDKASRARAYITMQKESKSKGKPSYASQRKWTMKEQ